MAQNLTILTLNQPNIVDFAEARNKLLSKAKTPWVLFLDQDESLSSELKSEIDQVIASPKFPAYLIPRQDSFLSKVLKHGETSSVRLLRLARRDWGTWQRPVHEVWEGKGSVGLLRNPIIHNPHTNLRTFAEKIDRYSEIEAEYRFKKRVPSNLLNILFYPLLKFISNYFLRLGFLDGIPGLIHAIFMSWHSYLTWTKLYLLWHKK